MSWMSSCCIYIHPDLYDLEYGYLTASLFQIAPLFVNNCFSLGRKGNKIVKNDITLFPL